MPDLHYSLDINRPPEAVFTLIADIAHYSQWLPPSKTYVETTVSESPIKAGSTYLDKNTSGMLYGEVLEYEPYTRVAFHQATKPPSIDITIHYVFSPLNSGTHLERTTSIVTSGFYRLLQPLVVARIREENQRTLGVLKAYLEK